MPLYPGRAYFQTLGTGISGTVDGIEISYEADVTYYGVQLTVGIDECSSDSYDDCRTLSSSMFNGGSNGRRLFEIASTSLDESRYYRIRISGMGPWGSMGPAYVRGSADGSYPNGSFSDDGLSDVFFLLHGSESAAPRDPRSIPVIVIPGMLGSWLKNGRWIIDPVFHVYDNLIDTFLANGYERDKTLFDFPYDWRESNEDSAGLLKQRIKDIRSICGCSKVDIVAHSMGGLVARYYLQSPGYDNDVRKIVFLGTPHKGSPKSYLAWEGGESAPNLIDRLLKVYLSFQGLSEGYHSFFEYVRRRPVASIRELLPIFDYLSLTSAASDLARAISYPEGYPTNPFLEDLSAGASSLSAAASVLNITGDTGTSTISSFLVVPSDPKSDRWSDGYPQGFDLPRGDRGIVWGSGDGTVTPAGSYLEGSDGLVIPSDHVSLPTDAESEIFEFISGRVASSTAHGSLPSRLLFQSISSVADILIRLPDGRRIGRDHRTHEEINEVPGAFYSDVEGSGRFVTIPDPMPGEYVATTGNDSGETRSIMSSLISDSSLVESSGTTSAVSEGEWTSTIEITDGGEIRVPEASSGSDPVVTQSPDDHSGALAPQVLATSHGSRASGSRSGRSEVFIDQGDEEPQIAVDVPLEAFIDAYAANADHVAEIVRHDSSAVSGNDGSPVSPQDLEQPQMASAYAGAIKIGDFVRSIGEEILRLFKAFLPCKTTRFC